MMESVTRRISNTKQGMLNSEVFAALSTETYSYNANKNITEIIDATGTLAAHYEYSPFGQITSATGNLKDDFEYRFSSEYFDSETGFVYYNFRYYSPKLARWLSRDPIEEKGGVNLYVFVGNDGVGTWDLLGKYFYRSQYNPPYRPTENIDGTPYVNTEDQYIMSVTQGGPIEMVPNPDYIPPSPPSRSSKNTSGVVDAFYNLIKNQVMSDNISYSISRPIGAIGGVSFNITVSISGELVECCNNGSRGTMVKGIFTVGGDMGFGAVVSPNGDGSQMRGGSSAGGGSGSGFSISSDLSGELPVCETKWDSFTYALEVQFVAGFGWTGINVTQSIAECDASMNCKWTYSKPPSISFGDGGVGARIQIVATGSAGFQYYKGE